MLLSQTDKDYFLSVFLSEENRHKHKFTEKGLNSLYYRLKEVSNDLREDIELNLDHIIDSYLEYSFSEILEKYGIDIVKLRDIEEDWDVIGMVESVTGYDVDVYDTIDDYIIFFTE